MTFFETGKAVVSEGVIGVGNYDILRKILMEAGCLADDIMLQIEETKRKIKCIETTKRHDFSSSESLSRSKGVLVGLSVASYCAAVEYQHDALLIPSLVIEENIPMETTFSFSTSLCSENWWVSSGPDFASILSKFTVYQDEVYQHDALFPVLARLVDQENKSIEKILTASRCYLTKANYKKNMTFLETLIALESEGVIGIGNYEILIRILEKAGCLSDDTMLAIEETTQKPKCSEISIRVSFLFSVNPVLKLDHVLLKREKVLEILGSSKMLISNIFSFKSFNEPQNQRMCLDTEVVLLYFSMNGQAHESGVFFLSVSAVSELLLASTEKMEESMFFGVTASETRERSSWKTPCFSERALHSRIGPQICGIFIAFYIKRRTYHQPALFSEPGHWLGKKDKSESEDWIGVGVYDILRKIIDEAGCLYDAKQKIIFSETSFLFSVNHGLKLDVVLPKKDKVLKTFGSSKILKSYIKSFNSFNEPQNQRICRNSEVVPQYFSVNGRTSGSGVFFRTVSADRKELIQTSSTKEMEESVFLVFTASEPRESSSWKTPCFSERALQNKIGQQGFGISNACYSEEACQTYNRNSKPATRSGQGNLWMKFSLFMLILLGTSVGGSCLPASCPGEILKANVSRDVLIWVNDSKPIRIKRFYLNHLTPQEKETCVSDPVVTEGVERAVVMCVLAVFLQWQIWQHLFYVSFQGLPRTSGESSRLLMIRVFLCLTVNGSAAESVPKGVGLDDCEFCHQICQPNIMKMNCDKYCSNLCGNERFSAEVFNTEPGRDTLHDIVKWFGIVSAVMVIILLLHLFVFSEVSNHLNQGCHDMPGPESVVKCHHFLMYSKRCLFSVLMEAIEKKAEEANSNSASVLSSTEKEESPDVVDVFDSETERSERKSYDIDSETDDTNATNKNKQITDLTPCNTPKQERVSDKTWDDQNYWDAQNSESLESVSDSDDSARITDRGNSKDVSYDQDVICGTDLSGSTNSSEGTQESADTGNSPVQCTTAEQQTETKSVNKQPEVELNTIDTDDENVFPVTTYNSSAKDVQQDLQHLMQRLRDAEATIQRAPVLPAVCHKNENMLVKLGFHIVHASCSCVVFTKPTEREELQHINSTFRLMGECTEIFENNRNFKLQRRQDPCLDWLWHVRRRNYHTKVPQMQKIHGSYHRANSSRVKEDVKRDRTISDRRICDRSSIKRSQKTNFKSNLFKMTDIEEQMINTNEETHEMNWQCPTQRLYNIPSLPITNSPDRTTADSVVKKGQEDDDDDCDILRNITWLPLEDLPVPQIHTDIIVNSAAQVILDRIAKGETVGAQESMKFEVLRVCTYRNYPGDNKPFRLLFASAGWYYASDNDEVVCYRCGVRKSNWNEADNPSEIHTKMRPGCDFLVKNSEVNIPIPELESSKLIKFKKLDELLDSRVQIPVEQLISSGCHGNLDLNSSTSPRFRFFTPPPKHPQYALQAVRLDSFRGWPTNIPQTAATMAECGYYYAGFGDCVRCFHCGIGLRHWTDEDNPWIEHARWSKDCVYLRQMKGEEFIQNVYLAIQEEEEREDVEPETQSGQAGNISQIAPSDDSSQILLTDPAQSVLEMGYQPKIIKRAIDAILHNEGRSGITAMKIMEQIFRFEENSELEQGVANMNIASGSEVQSQNSPSTGQTQNKGNGSKEPNSSTGTKAQSQSVTGQSQENKETGHSENSPKSQGQKKDTNKKAGDTVQTRSKEPSATGKQEEAAASAKPSPQSSLDENVKGAIAENSKNDTTKIKAENRKLKEQTICKVCLDKAVSIVFLPCGHLVTCAECAPAMKKCPICRGLVKGSVKAFMS